MIADTVFNSGIYKMINHRYLIIPGLAARLSGETEEVLGGDWQVLVGPKDSSGIPRFLEHDCPPKDI